MAILFALIMANGHQSFCLLAYIGGASLDEETEHVFWVDSEFEQAIYHVQHRSAMPQGD
jgi:hypothetical protein